MPDRADNRKRQKRRFDIQVRAYQPENGEGARELWVEGRAVCFDTPTMLYEEGGVEFKEQIATGAFDGCNMSDVIFNYNHGGKVMARTRNGTLQLSIEADGLYVRARLDGTEEGRRMYEEIEKGYIDRMSFRFDIAEESFDDALCMWTVYSIRKLWDVSAVDLPAYDDTMIEARKADAARARIRRQEEAGAAQARTRLRRKRAELSRRCALLNIRTMTGGTDYAE